MRVILLDPQSQLYPPDHTYYRIHINKPERKMIEIKPHI